MLPLRKQIWHSWHRAFSIAIGNNGKDGKVGQLVQKDPSGDVEIVMPLISIYIYDGRVTLPEPT